MKKTVLIIAPPDDVHAQAVAAVLDSEFNASAVIWDKSEIPAQGMLSIDLTGDSPSFEIKNAQVQLSLETLTSVWWRRLKVFNIDEEVTDRRIRAFCIKECDAMFRGMFNGLPVPIVNDPTAQSVSERKPLQLLMAKRSGLKIPQTLMTNDAKKVRAFWERLDGNCIYKAFTPSLHSFAETRMLKEEDLKHLGQLRHAPIIVQEKIEKGMDVRVNIFGDRVFAASVTTHIPEAQLDWRLDLTAIWKEHVLPDEVAAKLRHLLRRLGLQYGCIDLRQQPDETYVFLEVNPAGQFLFIEVDTGQPLTRSFAELLLQPNVAMDVAALAREGIT